MTLDLLGSLLLARGESAGAAEALERACPLMELLPQTVVLAARGPGQGREPAGKCFAEECFASLRQVYAKLQDSCPPGEGEAAGGGLDVELRLAELRSQYSHLLSMGCGGEQASSSGPAGEAKELERSLAARLEAALRRFVLSEELPRTAALTDAEGILTQVASELRARRFGEAHVAPGAFEGAGGPPLLERERSVQLASGPSHGSSRDRRISDRLDRIFVLNPEEDLASQLRRVQGFEFSLSADLVVEDAAARVYSTLSTPSAKSSSGLNAKGAWVISNKHTLLGT